MAVTPKSGRKSTGTVGRALAQRPLGGKTVPSGAGAVAKKRKSQGKQQGFNLDWAGPAGGKQEGLRGERRLG